MVSPQRVRRSTRKPHASKSRLTSAGAWRAQADLALAGGFLIVAALFGGGVAAWTPSYVLVVMAAVLLAGVSAWRDGFASFGRVPLAGRLALAGIVLIPLLQLAPLPPSIWRELPGQGLRGAVLDLTDLGRTWQPVSLEPASTAIAALLAGAFVVFIGLLLRLADQDFDRLLRLAFVVVLVNIVTGLMQVVTDGAFPKFYTANFGGTMLGFFANKNHMALVIACSMLLFGFVVSRKLFARDKRTLLVMGYLLLALICLVTTNSRAGLALGALAAVIVSASLVRGLSLRVRIGAFALIAVVVAAILSSAAFETVSGRIDDVDSDLRWRFIDWSWPLARRYALLGAGAGSFATLFATHEQLGWLKPTYVNHVHNDYLEILIEMGVPALLVAALLLLSLAPGLRALRRLPRGDAFRPQLSFGLATILLFALHSGIDYPLRRPAAWTMFALALASVYRSSTRAPLEGAEVQSRDPA
jgi:O-antigen ligase